jgi:hypothetical protein
MALQDFKRPLHFMYLLLTTLSLLLAFVFYKKSESRREIVYDLSGISTVYNSRSSSSKIRVLDANSKSVTSDVLLMTFAFWNNGNLPIDPSDMRRPIDIVFEPCEKILNYTILHQTDPESTHFRLIEVDVEGKPRARAIRLMWQHLDPNEGIKFQVLFTGESSTTVSWGGKFAGEGRFVNGTSFKRRNELAATAMGIGQFVALFIAALLVRVIWDKTHGRNRLVSVTLFLLIVGVCSFILHGAFHPEVPAPFDVNPLLSH